MSRAEFERRWLPPAYRLKDSVVAWECATCGKLFSMSVEEAEASANQSPPPYIEAEFRLHSCDLHLGDRISDVELYYIGSGPEGRQYEIRTTNHGRIRR